MHGSRWRSVIGMGIVAGTAAVGGCSGEEPEGTADSGVVVTGDTDDSEDAGTGSGPTEDPSSTRGPGTVGGDAQAAEGCAEIGAIEEDGRICFYDAEDPQTVVASIQHVLGTRMEGEVLYLRLELDRQFVDNTYGQNAIGWDGTQDKKGKGGHTFKDLVGSDKGGLKLKDEDGNILLDFEIDYLSVDESAPSGYASLGVWGGDGKVLEGPQEAVVAATSSLDRNLNERGYGEYTIDSPATDSEYTPHPDAPEWDFDVVYEAWVSTDLFVDRPVHHACIDAIHASPSKTASHTLTVIPGPCGCPGGDCGSGGDSDTSGGDSNETGDFGDSGGPGDSGDDCEFDPDIGCDNVSVPPIP